MTKENRIKSFHKVKELAGKKGITFYALCKELGFTRVLFSDWKSGKSMPKTDKLVKIADYFNVPVTYFLE